MNYDPLPQSNQPKPFDQLLESTLQVYGRNFGPLVGTAALGLIPSNFIQGVWQPENTLWAFVALLVALIPGMMAQAALTVLAWQLWQKKAADITVGYGVAISVAPKYVGMQALIFAVTLAPLIVLPLIPFIGGILAIFLLPIGLFLATRWTLAGPAMILDQLSISQSMQMSWNLVHGRALRTFVAMAAFGVALILTTLVALGLAALFGGSIGAEVVMLSICQAIATPLAAIFFLLMYLDYKRVATAPFSPEPPEPPSFIR